MLVLIADISKSIAGYYLIIWLKYYNSIRYIIILIVNYKTTNFNCVIIFVLQIKFIAKFRLTINLENTIQYLVENFVKIVSKLRSFEVYLLLSTKLLY